MDPPESGHSGALQYTRGSFRDVDMSSFGRNGLGCGEARKGSMGVGSMEAMSPRRVASHE